MSENWVALLGVKGGPAIRPGSAMPTAHLLCFGGRRIVVDCGLGVTRGLCDQGMALADLDLIFVTHLHSDHYLELGPLLHTAWTAGLKRPVRVFGPKGLGDYWRDFCAAMRFDIDLRIADEGRPDLRSLVTVTAHGEGPVLDEPGLRVTALRNDHPPIRDSFALRVEAAGRCVVFGGDTAPFPPLADFARGADLLIHEAILLPAIEALVARVGNGDDRLKRHILRSHTPAADAARIAAEAGVKALALNHLIPSDDPAYGEADWIAAVRPVWDGPLFVGRDGLRISLG
jgi:ribonuclease BN (tRNA processing enzyme)